MGYESAMTQQDLSPLQPGLIVIDENYLGILEKTNQQLNISVTLYGVVVGILALIVGILAIGVISIIFVQGREYNRKLKNEQKKRDERLEDVLEGIQKVNKEKVEKSEKLLDELIVAYKKNLKNAKNEGRRNIEEILLKLEKERTQVDTTFVLTTDGRIEKKQARMSVGYYHCSDCSLSFSSAGNTQFFTSTPNVFALPSGMDREVFCPKCNKKII